MIPFRTLLAALVALPALVCAGLTQADVIQQPVTLPNGQGTGVLFINEDQSRITAGVIVVHERWGLDQYARDRARMLAKEGYEALAVDIYGNGEVASHPDDASEMTKQALAHPQAIKARFDAAKSILRDQQYVDDKRIFAIGYGFGGGIVMDLVRQGEDLAGAAVFSAPLATDTPLQEGTFKGRLFIAAGLNDALVPRAQIDSLIDELTAANVSFELLTFPGAQHAFTNPKADEYGRRFDLPLKYDPGADRTSWHALLDFLDQT